MDVVDVAVAVVVDAVARHLGRVRPRRSGARSGWSRLACRSRRRRPPPRALARAAHAPAGRTPSPVRTPTAQPSSASSGSAAAGVETATIADHHGGQKCGPVKHGGPPAGAPNLQLECSCDQRDRVGICGRMVIVASLVLWLSAAPAQRADRCASRPLATASSTSGCGLGLRSVYGLDVRAAFIAARRSPKRASARSTTASPMWPSRSPRTRRCRGRTSSPCATTSAMIYSDHVVPVVRREPLARRTGAATSAGIRRAPERGVGGAVHAERCAALNQAVVDGRLPEAVGGEFVDANGLDGPRSPAGRAADRRRLHGVRRERDARPPVRGGVARGRLPGPRAQRRRRCGPRRSSSTCAATRSISTPPTTVRCCATSSATSPARLAAGLRHTLARIDAEPLRLARAQRRQVFVMKADAAARLDIAKLSDLARYWQTAAR